MGGPAKLTLDRRPIQFHDEGEVTVLAEFFETETSVESLGAFVCGADTKMDGRHATFRKDAEQSFDHRASPSARLGFGQNIDVKMRRIKRFKTQRAAVRVGDPLQNIDVLWSAGGESGDLLANMRPPALAELPVECSGVGRADNIADDPLAPGEHKGKVRGEFEIGHRPYVAGKAPIAIKRARIGTGISRHQANVKEGLNIFFCCRADEIIVALKGHGITDLLAAARHEQAPIGREIGKTERLRLTDGSLRIFGKE